MLSAASCSFVVLNTSENVFDLAGSDDIIVRICEANVFVSLFCFALLCFAFLIIDSIKLL